jgi:plastocyanin
MTRITAAALSAVVLILIVGMVAACSGGTAAAVTPPPAAAATIDAKDGQFSSDSLHVPAGTSFELFFRNLDWEPHNVAIYVDSSASDPVFSGQTIMNAATTYEMPALKAGSYYFRCDVHPNMKGTLTAGS